MKWVLTVALFFLRTLSGETNVPERILFVIKSSDTRVDQSDPKTREISFTMYGVNSKVSYFIDRPIDTGGTMTMDQFIAIAAANTETKNFKLDITAALHAQNGDAPDVDVPMRIMSIDYDPKTSRVVISGITTVGESLPAVGNVGESILIVSGLSSWCPSCIKNAPPKGVL
ncbi:MAG: hypothetical protein A3F09_05230 [Chlamydiae bacterium RIFCSPHIGHO2_12_FULL_49_11]|nr:MAG: hypothetical protein A3F09_05230 [Chlamydiae bacterium RIFCSPHIGHO2_12_FULL_49_11]